MTRKIFYWEAIRDALSEEMERDPSVFLMGEDVGIFGGAFGVTRGLFEKFGSGRVIDTPISEQALTGVAAGSAMTGGRPVLEIMYMDFLTLTMDQLVNHAAKMRYMSGGQVKIPMTIRTAAGVGALEGAQHCQSLEAWLMHVPGLKVACPSTPHDAKGLLKASIRDDNPVVFVEHKMLYFTKGHVPTEDYYIPFGRAEVRRQGSHVTIISYSRMCQVVMEALVDLERDGIDAEVLDLRTVAPLDVEAIVQSVRKTSRAMVVEEGCRTTGVGAEVSSLIMEEAFDYLDGPVARLGGLDVPVPCAPNLEPLVIPTKARIVEAAKGLVLG